MQLSDFSASVLHEIFHPATTTSIDPKLVLSTRTAYLPPASISPEIKDHGSSSSPAPVPLSVHELERVDSKPELSHLVNVAVPVSSSSPPPSANVGGKSSPVDIVHLAAEEIRKPLLKFKDESKAGRVAWPGLAGLVTHLPGSEPAIPPGYPAYHSPHPHSGYSPHLGLHSTADLSYSQFGSTMGVTPPTLSSAVPTTATSVSNPATPAGAGGGPTYKMEPTDPGLYYPGTAGALPEGDPHAGAAVAATFQPSHTAIPGVGVGGPELGSPDFMQTLQTYMGQPVDMQHHEDGSSWLGEHSSLHPGFLSQDFDYSRGSYTDRKKKIIQEWNKTNKSPRPPETLTSADPLRQPAPSYLSAAGHHELFQHPYNPYANVKDEPLRADYPYYGYPDLVNPYVHMGRKEKRKKHDSLPGGQTLTRDERKAQQMGLPITCADIINLPMDEFNDLLSKHELTEEQLTLCRDIRRRGKNKVAAQNCRKRKIDQIKQLETEVTRIKCRKTELVGDHEKLLQQRATWSDLVKRLHDYVLKELGRDPQHWQLQMDHNRQVHILPRNSPPPHLGDQNHHQQPLPGQEHHHDQAVNMAAPVAKGSLYDMTGSGHPHLQHPPNVQTLSQNSS